MEAQCFTKTDNHENLGADTALCNSQLLIIRHLSKSDFGDICKVDPEILCKMSVNSVRIRQINQVEIRTLSEKNIAQLAQYSSDSLKRSQLEVQGGYRERRD
jgi:hypothetical protein